MSSFSRIARNVRDLTAAQEFYCKILGFTRVGSITEDPELASLLGIQRLRCARLRLGAQEIELSECLPAGMAYPTPHAANDPWFQHIALVTSDIAAAHAQIALHATAISTAGPTALTGLQACKYRDPDGHPFELLQFAPGHGNPAWQAKNRLMLGYDHTAITASNLPKTIEFYANFGFSETARQHNAGPAQAALDGLDHPAADIVTLKIIAGPPHVELLHYTNPHQARRRVIAAHDIAATRLVLAGSAPGLALRRDPDGHFVLCDGRKDKGW
jgi:catechol 2,3-dioxygenase-like lactoylglutathione lyase family enzyme